MSAVNGSFVSPSADAVVSPQLFEPSGLLASLVGGLNVWKAIVTLFLGAVIYDQREYSQSPTPGRGIMRLCSFPREDGPRSPVA